MWSKEWDKWVLCDTKYICIEFDLKSWAIPLCIDWRHQDITRPYYIDILCFHFELGQDPYGE